MVLETWNHPLKKLFDICDDVDESIVLEDVGVLCKKLGGDDSLAVFLFLEVRVRITEEHLLQARFRKVVYEKFHGVGADVPHVVVRTGRLRTELLHPLLTELFYAIANF